MSSYQYQLKMLRNIAIRDIKTYVLRNGPTTIQRNVDTDRELTYKIKHDEPYTVINEASATLLGADELMVIADLLNASSVIVNPAPKVREVPNIRLPYKDE
jgi:hypothetical protein